jgi:hypothetical protein
MNWGTVRERNMENILYMEWKRYWLRIWRSKQERNKLVIPDSRAPLYHRTRPCHPFLLLYCSIMPYWSHPIIHLSLSFTPSTPSIIPLLFLCDPSNPLFI